MDGSSSLKSLAGRLLPRKFLKHYVLPTGLRRPQVPFRPKQFFESWYRSTLGDGLEDGMTISGNRQPLSTRYHYNGVENSILEYFASHPAAGRPSVLDVGSGAGHWIDFYRHVFGARHVSGVELSPSCVAALRAKYAGIDDVRIVETDVSAADFRLEGKFDLINAIGVMFHIVDDCLWTRAVGNLAGHLAAGGVMVVGGQFGWITRNVQFHGSDEFSSWQEFRGARGDVALVNKRIRSLRSWRACARRFGLRVEGVRRTRQRWNIATPENHVLFLSSSPS